MENDTDILNRVRKLTKNVPMLNRFGRVHMVTMPTEKSVLVDCLIQNVDLKYILHCVMGGLDADRIVMITEDLALAKQTAEFLLSEPKLPTKAKK